MLYAAYYCYFFLKNYKTIETENVYRIQVFCKDSAFYGIMSFLSLLYTGWLGQHNRVTNGKQGKLTHYWLRSFRLLILEPNSFLIPKDFSLPNDNARTNRKKNKIKSLKWLQCTLSAAAYRLGKYEHIVISIFKIKVAKSVSFRTAWPLASKHHFSWGMTCRGLQPSIPWAQQRVFEVSTPLFQNSCIYQNKTMLSLLHKWDIL